MNILGVSAFYHDSAACLVRDGLIVAAAQEERFSRRKNDASFPRQAIAYCLKAGGIPAASDLDIIAFYELPALRLERIIDTFAEVAPRGSDMFARVLPNWAADKIWMERGIRQTLEFEGPVDFHLHHLSHAASAFFPSPFPRAAVLTLDGVGEWATTTWGTGEGNHVRLQQELHYPHSLGLLYSAFTYHLGFKINSGEYKVMGLAPYGEPRYVERILDKLIEIRDDGSFTLATEEFDFLWSDTMTGAKFEEALGVPRREPESLITQEHMDLARSIQTVTNRIVVGAAKHVRAATGETRLCVAGGVALNCVANAEILRQSVFDEVWIQPAAGDAGGALGAALLSWHHTLAEPRSADGKSDQMRGALLGPDYSDAEIRRLLEGQRIPHEKLPAETMATRVAALIDEGNVIGWFQGRMEFGPRALGARSILADPRSADMQSKLNLKIKFRESFRPFAPSVLAEHAHEYFDLRCASPYMLLVAPVREEQRLPLPSGTESVHGIDRLKLPRSQIPAVTHIDYSARVQTVTREHNVRYHDLLSAFHARTGCPVLANTSFNVRGEPIVRTPQEAFRCFMKTEMDYLILGSCLLEKRRQVTLHPATQAEELALD